MFPRGVFTLSLDFELVWGSRDLTTDLASLAISARRTRDRVFQPLLALLGEHGFTATWATVGALFLDGESVAADLVSPRGWLDGVPTGTEAEHPAFYARSLVLRLRDAGQEIGSHSFTHALFGTCTRETADSELARCVAEAAKLGITLRSFVFPRNVPGHLDLLPRHGFTCWRGMEPTWRGRLAHFVDVARAACPATVMPERGADGLVCVPASASFLPIEGVRRLIPVSRRVERCVRGLERASEERRVFHLYLHPINLAGDPERMLAGMGEVLAHARRLRDAGRIDVLSMGEVASRA